MDGRRAAPTPASRGGGVLAGGPDLGDDDQELDVFAAERYFSDALAAENAFWCDDRSSSSFSSLVKAARREGSAVTPTAATSSSEASWNSRCALLPNQPALAAVEAKPVSETAGGRAGVKPRPSSSYLRRWLLGVAGCSCGGGGVEESATADLCRDEAAVGSVYGYKKRSTTSTEADTTPRRTSKETSEEVSNGDALLAGTSGGSSTRVLNPAAKASLDEHRRVSSASMFLPALAGEGGTLVPAGQSSAFTIVAGTRARGGAAAAPTLIARSGGAERDSGVDDDAAAPSEVECNYPPSEASVVWSVVTAEGAASGNFSSAASGYYYHHRHSFNGDDEEAWRLPHTLSGRRSSSSSRSRIHGGGMLMGCISRRAADAVVGSART